MVSIDHVCEVVHGLFKEPITGPLKSKMAEIRHLENRHDVNFFCWGWSDLDKMSQTGDMVKMETRCRIPIWRTFGRIQRHVIPEPPATLQGAATWRIQCHDPRATCHIAECCHLVNSLLLFQSHMHVAGCSHLANNSIRHIKNVYHHILFYLFFVFKRLTLR